MAGDFQVLPLSLRPWCEVDNGNFMIEIMDLDSEYNNWLAEQAQLISKTQKGFVGCRGYNHFDSRISINRYLKDPLLRKEICNPALLAKHKFWPFIRQDKKVRRYTRDIAKNLVVKNKLRPIMYASHRDATVMSFYSWLLKRNYESIINKTAAAEAVIGYRRIPIGNGHNKSNIDFAKDVFDLLHNTEDSVLLCIDIKDFFGNIDHNLLIEAVKHFSGGISADNLTPILKAVTRYRYIFRKDVILQLGKEQSNWANSKKYNALIRDANLIHQNRRDRGIPQGSPISDALANIYLYDFDLWLAEKVATFGGIYRRYSDDILIIVPKLEAKRLYRKMCDHIEGGDFKLEIGKNKTEAFYVDVKNSAFKDITSEYVSGYAKNKETAQYLGFNINTCHMSIRPGTITKHYRKEINRLKRKKKSPVVYERKHMTNKTAGRKYQYFKTTAKKIGNSTTRQFRRIRKRNQKRESE